MSLFERIANHLSGRGIAPDCTDVALHCARPCMCVSLSYLRLFNLSSACLSPCLSPSLSPCLAEPFSRVCLSA